MYRAAVGRDSDATVYETKGEVDDVGGVAQQAADWASQWYPQGYTVPVICTAPSFGFLRKLVAALEAKELVAGLVFYSGGFNLKNSMAELKEIVEDTSTGHFLVDVNRFLFLGGNKKLEGPLRNTSQLMTPEDLARWHAQDPAFYTCTLEFARAFNIKLMQVKKLFRVDSPNPGQTAADLQDHSPQDPSVRDHLESLFSRASKSGSRSDLVGNLSAVLDAISLEKVANEVDGRCMTEEEKKEFSLELKTSEVAGRRALVEDGWRPCIKDQKGHFLRLPDGSSPLAIETDLPLAEVYIPLIFDLLVRHPEMVFIKHGDFHLQEMKFGTASSVVPRGSSAETKTKAHSVHLMLSPAETSGHEFDRVLDYLRNFLLESFISASPSDLQGQFSFLQVGE